MAQPKPQSSITCVLGKVACGQVPVDVSKAGRNSTKWILDVCVDTEAVTLLDVELLDYGTGKRKDDLVLSFALAPLNDAAHEARLCVVEPEKARFTLSKDKGLARYRICIDSVHSASR